MNDFLDRMILRTNGPLSQVQPILPSIFAPLPGLHLTSEVLREDKLALEADESTHPDLPPDGPESSPFQTASATRANHVADIRPQYATTERGADPRVQHSEGALATARRAPLDEAQTPPAITSEHKPNQHLGESQTRHTDQAGFLSPAKLPSSAFLSAPSGANTDARPHSRTNSSATAQETRSSTLRTKSRTEVFISIDHIEVHSDHRQEGQRATRPGPRVTLQNFLTREQNKTERR